MARGKKTCIILKVFFLVLLYLMGGNTKYSYSLNDLIFGCMFCGVKEDLELFQLL